MYVVYENIGWPYKASRSKKFCVFNVKRNYNRQTSLQFYRKENEKLSVFGSRLVAVTVEQHVLSLQELHSFNGKTVIPCVCMNVNNSLNKQTCR